MKNLRSKHLLICFENEAVERRLIRKPTQRLPFPVICHHGEFVKHDKCLEILEYLSTYRSSSYDRMDTIMYLCIFMIQCCHLLAVTFLVVKFRVCLPVSTEFFRHSLTITRWQKKWCKQIRPENIADGNSVVNISEFFEMCWKQNTSSDGDTSDQWATDGLSSIHVFCF